ncbi:MAG: RNA polymerase sigma factor [Cyclobacteriaceae bacterium]
MFRYAVSMLQSASTAEDIVQDSLLKIWDKRKTLDSIQNPEAWAMRVVRNGCIDNIRANKFTAFEESHENRMYVNNEDTMVYEDQRKWYQETIDTLPDKQKEVFHLREVECLSYQEISGIMSITESDVKVNLHRARTKVRETMKRLEAYGVNRIIAG